MSFQDKLKENQMKHAETALLQTIFQDPGQTIGDIWEALEADTESEAMWEMYKKLPIGKLVTAAASFVGGIKTEEPASSASTKGKVKPKPAPKQEEEDEDEFEDDDSDSEDDEEEDEDEFEDDDDDDDDEDEFEDEEEDEEDEDAEDEEEDDEEEEEVAKKPKSKKKGKAKASSSKSKKSSSSELDLSSPESQKAYRHAIVKCLKSNKARDEDTAMRSTPIREQIGGDAKQFREQINELIEAERVAFSGKARGTKYWLA